MATAGAEERPPGYPVDLECTVLLADGRAVYVRPVLPSDAGAVTEAIANADPETLRLRFLGAAPPRAAGIRRLVTVDYQHRLALAAFDGAGRGVAIARYEGRPNEADAELAVVVTPDWRRVGLATALLNLLGLRAIGVGIRSFRAEYSAANVDVRELLADSGLSRHLTSALGVIDERLTLPDLGVGGATPGSEGASPASGAPPPNVA